VIKAWHFIYAFTLALLLHILVVVSWAGSKKDEGAIADGQDGLQISVGLAGSFDESLEVAAHSSEPEEAESEEIEPAEQSELAEKIEAQQKLEDQFEQQAPTAAPTPPETEPAAAVAPEAESVITDEQVVKKTLKQVAKRVAKKGQPAVNNKVAEKQQTPRKSKPKAQVTATTSITEKTTERKTQASKARNKATGVGERVETGGKSGAKQSYLVKVLAKIARNKRYPRSARRAGVVGTVTVKFVINKNGRVKDAAIVTSSGDKRLDKEALAMLRRASPFPAIPKDAGGDSMSLTLPVEFSLNQTRKLF